MEGYSSYNICVSVELYGVGPGDAIIIYHMVRLHNGRFLSVFTVTYQVQKVSGFWGSGTLKIVIGDPRRKSFIIIEKKEDNI